MVAVALWGAIAPAARAAPAGASEWGTVESGRVRLVAAGLTTGTAPVVTLGLEVELAPGWKIYWRNPGDAGYPPRIDWTGSLNLERAGLRWPAPHRFVLAGLQSFGYRDGVILPIDAVPRIPGGALALRAQVDYLACATLCVPQSAALSLDLPAGAVEMSEHANAIARFTALVPGDGRAAGLAVDRAEVAGEGADTRLRLSVTAAEPFDHPDLFLESDLAAAFTTPVVTVSPDRRRVTFDIRPTDPPTQALAGRPLTVTVVDGVRSVEAQVVPAAVAAGGPDDRDDSSGPGDMAAMLAVAVLGGMILNLMPCVLPVLSIKILGVLGHGGAARRHVRLAFLASAAGILASFLLLAGLAIAARAAGLAVGWGMQFQQPAFLGAMTVILALFAANLGGLFEIPLPRWLLDRTPEGIARHTLGGHFLSGAFATLLATPCSAPFLGTAVGFALSRGAAEIVAIFAALGVGMAVPFLLVALWPDAARRLPRPGRWMVWLRKALALALAATALWLGAILIGQWRLPAAPVSATTAGGAVAWHPFDPGRIDDLVGQGRVVFVDVTAAWCLTCKLNKIAVLDQGAVAARLSAPGVVAMRADWTRPDAVISAYLARFGRFGVPFNAVHGPGAPEGVALSEILSEAGVLAGLDRAAAPRP